MRAVLFIDGDNIPAYYYQSMIEAIHDQFPHIHTISHNLFINTKSPYFQQWYAKLSTYQEINLQIHHTHQGYTKNSIDIKITIEVMKIINSFDAIIIASNDSDFSCLATTIQSYHVCAIGIGTQTNDSYSRYWSHFLQLKTHPNHHESLKSLIAIAQQSQYISAKEALKLLNKTFKSPTVFQCKSWKQVCKQYADLFEYRQGIILPKMITQTTHKMDPTQQSSYEFHDDFLSQLPPSRQTYHEDEPKHHMQEKHWFSIGEYTGFMIQHNQIPTQEIFCFSTKSFNHYHNLIA